MRVLRPHHPPGMRSLRPPVLTAPQAHTGWYIHGQYDGRFYTRGPKDSEGEARAAAQAMFPAGADWDVYELPTRNIQRAKAMLRDRNLTRGQPLNIAMQHQMTKQSPRGITVDRN